MDAENAKKKKGNKAIDVKIPPQKKKQYEIKTEKGKDMKKIYDTSKKKYIRFKEGAAYYSMGTNKFQELAKEAHARVKIGQVVLVNRELLEKYLDSLTGEQNRENLLRDRKH